MKTQFNVFVAVIMLIAFFSPEKSFAQAPVCNLLKHISGASNQKQTYKAVASGQIDVIFSKNGKVESKYINEVINYGQIYEYTPPKGGAIGFVCKGNAINPNREDPTRSVGKFRWVTYQGTIRDNAFVGGYEPDFNRTLYICRVFYNNGIHPGKVVAGRCNIGYGTREEALNQFDILVGRGGKWVKSQNGRPIPQNAVVGGHEPGRTLYICRSSYGSGKHPGKIVAGRCNFGFAGTEHAGEEYEVLVHD